MSKVIVFHYTDKGKLPKLSESELNELKEKFDQELKNHPDVKFNGTFVSQNGIGFCDWDAPNAEIVNEIIKKVLGEAPIDGSVVVERVL